MARDEFRIHGYMRFVLVIRALAPLALGIVLISIVTQPRMKLSDKGPFILAGLAAWFLYEAYKAYKWLPFTLALSEQSIAIGGKEFPWSDIASASAKTAIQFQTFITLKMKNGESFVIPGAIQQPQFVLAKIEKHFPQIEKLG